MIDKYVYKILSFVCIAAMIPIVIAAFVLVFSLIAVKAMFNKIPDDPDYWRD